MSTLEPREVRIGNNEREAAVRRLGEHFSHGRLAPEEYEERMSAAYAARTAADLEPLFRDLPGPQTGPTAAVPQWPVATAPDGPTAHVPAPGPAAPYGYDPVSGRPYSDRSKVIAGVLQLVLPFGIGRFYSGHTGIALAQLLLSFVFIGAIWSFIDGIVLLVGSPTDPYGRPLRP